jgi:hypothetical protein
MPTEQATFLKRLEASGLLTDSIVAAWPRLTGLQSAEDAADELVRDSMLTGFQSEVLLGDDSVPLVIGDNLTSRRWGCHCPVLLAPSFNGYVTPDV